ncbi:hypothetical protein HZ326_23778 [Fusarium oxysporum f. sp. albedinis]|nr:hypothetical protein HZ326_23778 [Fusarium oxysporum f. sp. albedinis]
MRRGAWQAIAWTFLLDLVLVNSFLLQLHGQPAWNRYTNQKKWRECLYNEVFKAFHSESQSRQLVRGGDEFTPPTQHKHVRRGKKVKLPRLPGASTRAAKVKKLKKAVGAGQSQ